MADFSLEHWDDRGLRFARAANIAQMQTFLGGIEPDEAITARHERIVRGLRDGTVEMFLILVDGVAEPAGSVGYWEKQWLGETVYELGWKVLPEFQGRGLASRALTEVLARASARRRHPWGHAYPRVDNVASNTVCAKVGFQMLGEVDFEFPKGNPIRCNDWRYDLAAR